MKNRVIIRRAFLLILICAVFFISSSQSQMIADITSDITTNFGVYHPYPAVFLPSVPQLYLEPGFTNVQSMPSYSSYDSLLLMQNHFTVRKSRYTQIYDIYNECTESRLPIFITSDAVLHAYHSLFGRILMSSEELIFFEKINTLTENLLDRSSIFFNQVEKQISKETLFSNIAYFSVAKKILNGVEANILDTVLSLVNSELELITQHAGYDYSPVLGDFSKLDYSKLKVRGHYTRSDKLSAYFKAMMWYGWTIFTMEPQKFSDLAYRHTLQALIIVKAICSDENLFSLWENIYEPTVFFVGKTDDPNINDYKKIADQVYGENFVNLSIDSIANLALLSEFMAQVQLLPEPKIPNYIFGSAITYKGFRLMGQRMIPDSYMFSKLVWPFIYIDANSKTRLFPKGLDIMAILGSERASKILDSVYKETRFPNYAEQIANFKSEYTAKSSEEWAQNLYWNWLYCLMPLLYQKGVGYPYFMQTTAWSDKELLTSLASWAELRHDVILYAKQSETPRISLPDTTVPKSYVEPNPYLYARLASLVRFSRIGLQNQNLLLNKFESHLQLFEQYLLFLRDVAIKELENIPLTNDDYKNIFSFGKILEDLVTDMEDPLNGKDNMAIIADVHTDANTFQCLEEAVGYPLEIYVIVNEGGINRLTRGAIFSYYEFLQPISNRLTDEAWREMLINNSPRMPEWTSNFMDLTAQQPNYITYSPVNQYGNSFITDVAKQRKAPVPDRFILHQNYPNPFNPSTTIKYQVPNVGTQFIVSLKVFDILGREVATLVNEYKPAGAYSVTFYASNLPSGIYFYRLRTGNFLETRKLVVQK